MRPATPLRVALAVAAGAALLASACASDSQRATRDATCDGKVSGTTYLTAWFHASESDSTERQTIVHQVAAFNASQAQVRVKLITLPIGEYADLVRSAAQSGNLPDILDFDGPYLYNYAWSGKLKPIDSCIPAGVRSDLLPSIRQQGRYGGRTWGVGTFDSGLALYVRRSVLQRAGIRIPATAAQAWTAEEFTGILQRLRQAGYRQPLDLRLANATGEWSTFGFAPAIWSAGGDLINRSGYRTANGYLNGAPAVRSLTTIRSWVKAGYVDPNEDERAFEDGRTPISWASHTTFADYTKAFPGDVQLVPLPRFGPRPAAGMGSWQWGITAGAADGDAAWRFIGFLLHPREIVRMTDANGGIPATESAVRRSPRFAPGGPEHLFVTQLETGIARPRPQTPAYPELTAAFATAFEAIVVDGRPVQATLDRAARAVDQAITERKYYQPTGR